MSLDPVLASIVDELAPAHAHYGRYHPGEPTRRQPLHTVYGGAQLFRHDVAPRLGVKALEAMEQYAPEPFAFARAIGLRGAETLPKRKKDASSLADTVRKDPVAARLERPDAWLAVTVFDRVVNKLGTEPVEDYRIDFEDGFGPRSDDEEDDAAVGAGHAICRGLHAQTLPPFIGIRIKPLDARNKHRAAQTLELFLEALTEDPRAREIPRFIVTLPKVHLAEEVSALGRMLTHLEERFGLPHGWARVELMTEEATSFFSTDGRLNLPGLLDASDGRCIGVHFGSYDFSSSVGIASGQQTMDHPWCDLALGLIKLGYSRRGIFLSDGATNVLPVPLHRGASVTKAERKENEAAIHQAWALSYRNIRRSLSLGLYQGWDLHPAQLPVRYAATYAFFLEELPGTIKRLRGFIDAAARATLSGTTFDDAASGLGLLELLVRGHQCGAFTEAEIERAGVTIAQAQGRDFAAIVKRRTP
jgi:citrate lyase beta subunit